MVAKAKKRKTEEPGAAQPARPPMPNWTLSVRDFGRVESADIEMAPMVVLVGKNNTGKSYMASLLWAMMNADEFLFNGVMAFMRSSAKDAMTERLVELIKTVSSDSGPQELAINGQTRQAIQTILNENLDRVKNKIFDRLFSYSSEVGSLRITLDTEGTDVPFLLAIDGDTFKSNYNTHPFSGFNFTFPKETAIFAQDWITQASVSVALTSVPFQGGNERPVFIPAARTGLMLAYQAIVAGAFETFGNGDDKQRTRLPLPVVRFLKCFTDLHTDSPSKLGAIVAALESELIEGKVDASKDPVPSFWYEPDLLKTQLPLHATSSMITELAPFLLLLKNGFSEHGLVFEEPEAHLHISAQRTLARLLVRIMNAGTRVVITTHSDTFIQQLNNLMQLHAHPRRDALMKKFGYTADDLLDPAMVKGYEFNPTKSGKTVVTPTKMNPGGLVVPSLNETLIDLAKELRALQTE